MKKEKRYSLFGDIIGILVSFIIFIIPFYFMFVNSLKDRKEANLLNIKWPDTLHWENYKEVITTNDNILLLAFKNSSIITIGSIVLLIIICSMAGYVLQRRRDKISDIINVILLSGLMVPPAILPTIWVMQSIGIYKTIPGIILVEVALQAPFTVMLYRSFMSSIPIEIEESAYIDGCTRFQLFTKIIFPLLKPVTATVVILNAVNIFNDFSNPLYFLPGKENTTVQLTLYNFIGRYTSSYNLLFADVIIITIPMLILFIIFNNRIVDGMVQGAVKG